MIEVIIAKTQSKELSSSPMQSLDQDYRQETDCLHNSNLNLHHQD